MKLAKKMMFCGSYYDDSVVVLRIRQLRLMNFLSFSISHDIDTLFPSAVSAMKSSVLCVISLQLLDAITRTILNAKYERGVSHLFQITLTPFNFMFCCYNICGVALCVLPSVTYSCVVCIGPTHEWVLSGIKRKRDQNSDVG